MVPEDKRPTGVPDEEPRDVAERSAEDRAPADEPTPVAPEGSAELAQVRSELAEATDARLRAQAELENFRRRAARQMDETLRYAEMTLLRDLLPVLDNIRRAIEAAEKTRDAAGLLEGFRLVGKQLEDVLGRHHCREIEAQGAPFDPHLHEAISQQPSAEAPPGTVLIVTLPGFQLHDRVVRPSQVVVSAAPPEGQGDGRDEGG